MRMRMFSLIAIIGFGSSPLAGQQSQPQPRGRQGTDPVTMQCGAAAQPRVQARPAAQGPVRGRFGDTLRAGRMNRGERPDLTMQTMGATGQFLPSVLLQRQERLKLSAAQIAGLQSLQKQAQADCARHVQLANATQRAANQLLEATAPDFAAYAAKLRETSAHTVEAQVAMAKSAVAARKVLTNGQRQTITARLQARRQ